MSVMEHGVLTDDRQVQLAGHDPGSHLSRLWPGLGFYIPPMFGWAFGPVTLCPDCNPEG